jgi:hypothetical protein
LKRSGLAAIIPAHLLEDHGAVKHAQFGPAVLVYRVDVARRAATPLWDLHRTAQEMDQEAFDF